MSDVEQLAANIRALTGRLAAAERECEGCFVERNPIGGHGRGPSRGAAK